MPETGNELGGGGGSGGGDYSGVTGTAIFFDGDPTISGDEMIFIQNSAGVIQAGYVGGQ